MTTDSSIAIRPATKGDSGALFALFQEVQDLHAHAEPGFFRPTSQDDHFLSYLSETLRDPDQQLDLACRYGKPVAYCHYSLVCLPMTLFRPARRFAYVHAISVTRDMRRQGCAALLLNHVTTWARAQAADGIGIDTWRFNEAARACFANFGFAVKREYLWLTL